MNQDQPETPADLHALAGEYVLGTLSSATRKAVDARLLHDAALRAAVLAWEERLLPLTALVEPLTLPPQLWRRIEHNINAQQVAKKTMAASPVPDMLLPQDRRGFWRGWDSLALWRTLTAGSFATAAVLALVLVMRIGAPQTGPQFMVVLVAPQDKAPGFVIQASISRQLSLTPLTTVSVPQDKALQFWTKADGWSGPVSLGLVKPGQTVRIALDKLPPLQANQLFELTLEPSTGSPIGKPTGPIKFIGRAVKVM